MSVDDSSGERVQEELAACSAQSSRAPAQTRVSVPHQLSEYQHSRKYGRMVWHRHSCLCLGEMDCLSLLTTRRSAEQPCRVVPQNLLLDVSSKSQREKVIDILPRRHDSWRR